jgi:hypothetical protein
MSKGTTKPSQRNAPKPEALSAKQLAETDPDIVDELAGVRAAEKLARGRRAELAERGVAWAVTEAEFLLYHEHWRWPLDKVIDHVIKDTRPTDWDRSIWRGERLMAVVRPVPDGEPMVIRLDSPTAPPGSAPPAPDDSLAALLVAYYRAARARFLEVDAAGDLETAVADATMPADRAAEVRRRWDDASDEAVARLSRAEDHLAAFILRAAGGFPAGPESRLSPAVRVGDEVWFLYRDGGSNPPSLGHIRPLGELPAFTLPSEPAAVAPAPALPETAPREAHERRGELWTEGLKLSEGVRHTRRFLADVVRALDGSEGPAGWSGWRRRTTST